MSMLYKGDKPCLGCGKAGYESQRYGANELCMDCKDLLRAGRKFRALEAQSDETKTVWLYESIPMLYAGKSVTGSGAEDKNSGEALHDAFYRLARALNQVEGRNTGTHPIGNHSSNCRESFNMKVPHAEALGALYTATENAIKAAERKGVMEGTNLLIRLNNSEISMDEFTRRRKS